MEVTFGREYAWCWRCSQFCRRTILIAFVPANLCMTDASTSFSPRRSFHSFEKGTKEWSVRTLSIGVFLWFKSKHMGSKIQISGTRVRRKHITRSSSWFPQLSTDESAEFRCTDTPCVGFPKNRSFPTHVLNDPRFSLINTWIELEWIHAYCDGLDILPLGHLEFDRSILPNISFLNWQALEMIPLWKTHLSRNHRINVRKADVDNVGIEIHLRWSRI